MPIYKHTIKRKERYNEPTRIKEFYEVRHGENSYYVLGGDSMIFGLTHEKSLLGCNIMSMVGYYIAKLIMDGENPFGESFFDNLQNNILYWNENEIERKNRYTNTERIAMERTIVDNGAISFTFPNAHGAFDTFVADVTNNKEYVFKRLKIG